MKRITTGLSERLNFAIFVPTYVSFLHILKQSGLLNELVE